MATGNYQHIFTRPLNIFGVPVDRETIFSDHRGIHKNHVEKRQRRFIVKTTFIKFYLHHGERIRCLTTGYSPVSVLEQVLTGPAFIFFKRAFFVFTDKRILHIPTRFDRSSHSAISQINYRDCSKLELKGRSLIVQYKNGTQESFPYIGRKEKKKIKALIADIKLHPKKTSELRSRSYLCPGCTRVLGTKASMCPACKLEFKSDFQARIRSYFIPGGGYLYSRYTYLGIAVGLLECLLIGYMVYRWGVFNSGIPIDLGILALLVGGLVAEKIIAAYHSQQLVQDLMPANQDFAMRKI